MSARVTTQLRGRLVAAVREGYGSFTDRKTGEVVPAGERLSLWLSGGADEAPVQIKCRDRAAFMEIEAAGIAGSDVDVVLGCTLFASGNRVVPSLDSFTLADDLAPAKAG